LGIKESTFTIVMFIDIVKIVFAATLVVSEFIIEYPLVLVLVADANWSRGRPTPIYHVNETTY